MLSYYIKLAAISIRRNLFLSALMVMAIAIGIGMVMTVLTVYYLLDNNPMSHKNDQLYAVQLATREGDVNQDNLDILITYKDAINLLQSDIPSRQSAMFYTGLAVQPTNTDVKPFFENTRICKSDFFSMFEVPFIYGSHWGREIDENPENVVVISKKLNNQLFDGKNSVGKTITLSGKNYRITGVIGAWEPSPKFYEPRYDPQGKPASIFVPFSLISNHQYTNWGNTNGWRYEEINSYQERLDSELMWLHFWVELLTYEDYQDYKNYLVAYAEEQKKIGRFQNDFGYGDIKNVAEWLRYNNVTGDDTKLLLILSFVFLSVCILNGLALLLAKFLNRAPEIGVRRALGANQSDIFFQHLVEVGIIGFLGGFLSVFMSFFGLSYFRYLSDMSEKFTVMNLELICIALFIAIVSGLLTGVYPAYRICRMNPAAFLKIQ